MKTLGNMNDNTFALHTHPDMFGGASHVVVVGEVVLDGVGCVEIFLPVLHVGHQRDGGGGHGVGLVFARHLREKGPLRIRRPCSTALVTSVKTSTCLLTDNFFLGVTHTLHTHSSSASCVDVCAPRLQPRHRYAL